MKSLHQNTISSRFFTITKITFMSAVLLMFGACSKIDNTSYAEIADEATLQNDAIETNVVSIAELISQTEELSLANEAVMKSNLRLVLNSNAQFTMFVPTNTALEELFTLLGPNYTSFDDFDNGIEIQILNSILMYHVIEGASKMEDLTPGELSTLFENNPLEVIDAGGTLELGDASETNAKFLEKDKMALNGVVHIIDKILLPQRVIDFLSTINPIVAQEKTIKEFLSETEDFALFREALEITGLLDELDKEGPYTVFLPNNSTLNSVFALLGNDFSDLSDFDNEIAVSLLREVVSYHIAQGSIMSNEFTEGSISTLSGDNTLSFESEDDHYVLRDGLDRVSRLVDTDVKAKNGIIHIVDTVLLPESIRDSIENTVALAFERTMLSSGQLNTSLELFKKVQDRIDLESMAEKEFTFFFPSDKAFVDLYLELGIETIQQFNTEEGLEILKTILVYHCVETGKVLAEDFTDGQILDTFQGEQLKVVVDSNVTIIDKTDKPSKLVQENLELLQGVIHVVDKVLIPEEILTSL